MRGDESTEDCGEEEEGGGHTGLEKGKENESRSVSGNLLLCLVQKGKHIKLHTHGHAQRNTQHFKGNDIGVCNADAPFLHFSSLFSSFFAFHTSSEKNLRARMKPSSFLITSFA